MALTKSKKRYRPKNANVIHKSQFELQDKIALVTTKAVGTMYAVYFFMLCAAGWMLWQTYFTQKPFDPYPFVFLIFLSNILQLLLTPLIMVGQNIQGRHAEIRAEEEFKTTTSTHKDIEHILVRLNEQDKELLKQSKLLEDLVAKH